MDVKVVKRLLRKESNYHIYFILSLVLLLTINGLALIPPILYQRIVDVAIPMNDLKNILLYTVIMVAIPLVSTSIHTLFMYHVYVKVKQLAFDVKSKIFEKLLNQPMSFFKKHDSGELASYLGIDIMDFFYFWIHDLPSVICSGVIVVVIVGILFKMNLLITTIMLISVPAALIPAYFLGKLTNKFSSQITDYNSDINSKITESFKFIKLVKAQCAQQKRIDEINQINSDNLKIFGKAVVAETLMLSVSKELVGGFFLAIAFILCSITVINQEMTLGELIAYTTYLPTLFGLVNSLARSNIHIQKQLGLQNKNFEFLAMDDEYSGQTMTNQRDVILGDITVNQLSFAYDDRQILNNLNFSIKKGEFVTIIGDSGCGKSTLLDLLMKFNRVDNGMISIHGVEINDLPIDQLRRQMALVNQSVDLLKGTLRYNLLIGNPNATDTEMLEAIELAELQNVVRRLPLGLDSDLSENALNLSGGERQRLSLAMALIKQPQILLLDEMTSSLDVESERKILSTIERICLEKQLTVISVTHRKTFIKDYFRVINLERGQIQLDTHYHELQLTN